MPAYAGSPTVKQGQSDSEEAQRMRSLETHQLPTTTSTYRPFGWKATYPRKSGRRKGVLGESGMHVSGLRYYSPGLGRWVNRDPISEDGGWNVYAFVRNDSVALHDYLGQAGMCSVPRALPGLRSKPRAYTKLDSNGGPKTEREDCEDCDLVKLKITAPRTCIAQQHYRNPAAMTRRLHSGRTAEEHELRHIADWDSCNVSIAALWDALAGQCLKPSCLDAKIDYANRMSTWQTKNYDVMDGALDVEDAPRSRLRHYENILSRREAIRDRNWNLVVDAALRVANECP